MFSTLGLGSIFAETFDQIASECRDSFPNGNRGSTIVIAADFSGSNKGQAYETYTFLVFDIENNSAWMACQHDFRHNVLISRRMSFKTLNDAQRREAIFAFLQAADCINGWLVTYAISKTGGSLFAVDASRPPVGWKLSVYEKVARVTHLGAYLLAGLARPRQDAYWIIDEDEIAANAEQLTLLTNHVANVSSHFSNFDLGRLYCATTRSDNGDYMIEDLSAICDLAAGATAEALTVMFREKRRVSKSIISPLPSNLTWKTKQIISWLGQQSNLRRVTIQIDLDEEGPGLKSKLIKWQRYSSPILTPYAVNFD